MGKTCILNQISASIPLDPDMNVMLVSSDKESGEAQTMHRCCSTSTNISTDRAQNCFHRTKNWKNYQNFNNNTMSSHDRSRDLDEHSPWSI
jgi:hypothetical protein